MHAPRIGTPLLLTVLLLLFAARLVHTSIETSFTSDEPHYVGKGTYLWKSGDYDWFHTLLFQPPLAYHLASVPLLAFDLGDFSGDPQAGHKAVDEAETPLAELRLASRLPFVLLTCWGAVLAFAWAREVAGAAAGLLAAFFFSFSPAILAYGPLVHSDMAVTVFTLQTLFAFWRWWRSPTARRLVLCGLSLGLALAAKASAVLLPAMLVGILALLAWRPGATSGLPARSGPALPTGAAALAGIGALALAVIWAAYGGSFRTEPARIGPFDALPVPNYLQIFLFTARIAQQSKPFWFFGELVAEPGWYFLPAAFLLKTPLPTLLLAIGAACQRSAAFREARLAVFLGVPALLYAGVACFAMKVPQGLRFLLPLYPLLFVFMATRLVALARPPARVGALALGAWLAATSLLAHPHYLSYFNALIGGPERAHRIFADSNLDWGQDLPRLARWLEQRGNPKIRVALFGPQSPEAFGIRAWPLPGCRPVDFGLLAISAAVLHGLHGARYPLPQPPPGCYAWLGQRQPIATLGSILVFDLGPRRGSEADMRNPPPARAAVY